MLTQELKLINKKGLHARAAAKLVQTSQPFSANLTLSFAGKVANCKNIMQLLMLAAPCGSPVTLTAEGKDAPAALAALVELINKRFDETE